MKRLISSIAALGLLFLTYTIIFQWGSSKPTLRIFTWCSFFDPQVLLEFEQEYQCKIVFDIFDSNELMYAKLKSGRTSYDLLTPTFYTAQLMADQQMLLPLDESRLSNLETLDPLYGSRGDYAPYCVPYQVTICGIGYLKSRLPAEATSWDLLADPRLKWRTTLLNDYRETFAAGLMQLGYGINDCSPEQIDHALKKLLTYKTNIAKFENEQYKLGLDCAEFLAVHAYNGDIAQLMTENPDVGFAIPQQGFTYSVDVFCLHSSCQQPELAHAFINFMHRPNIAARNTNHTCYLCPNTASYPFVDKKLRQNPSIFVTAEDMKRAQPLLKLAAKIQADLLTAWDRLKSESTP